MRFSSFSTILIVATLFIVDFSSASNESNDDKFQVASNLSKPNFINNDDELQGLSNLNESISFTNETEEDGQEIGEC